MQTLQLGNSGPPYDSARSATPYRSDMPMPAHRPGLPSTPALAPCEARMDLDGGLG